MDKNDFVEDMRERDAFVEENRLNEGKETEMGSRICGDRRGNRARCDETSPRAESSGFSLRYFQGVMLGFRDA